MTEVTSITLFKTDEGEFHKYLVDLGAVFR